MTSVRACAFILVAIGFVGAAFWVHHDNQKLRAEIDGLRNRTRQLGAARDENLRLQAELGQVKEDRAAAADTVHAELLEARRRVAALGVDKPSPSDRANADPSKGLVRMEQLRNVGQATPGAAFQTTVWAALRGEEKSLLNSIALDGPAQRRAEKLLSQLTPEERSKYPTPESIAALAVMALGEFWHDKEITVQIIGTEFSDPQHATLRLLMGGSGLPGKESSIPVELGAAGWRYVVPEGPLRMLEQRMNSGSSAPLSKK